MRIDININMRYQGYQGYQGLSQAYRKNEYHVSNIHELSGLSGLPFACPGLFCLVFPLPCCLRELGDDNPNPGLSVLLGFIRDSILA